jgi:hypothetical protein
MNTRELTAVPFWIDIAYGVSQGNHAKFSMCFLHARWYKFFIGFDGMIDDL